MRRLGVFLDGLPGAGATVLDALRPALAGWSLALEELPAAEPGRRIIAARHACVVAERGRMSGILQCHAFYEKGACLAWVIAPAGRTPIWILAPGRGELCSAAEPMISPSRLKRYGSRIGLTMGAPQVSAVLTSDDASWRILGRTAQTLAENGPLLLALASDRLPANCRRIREMLCTHVGTEALAVAEEMSPEQVSHLLAGGRWGALPKVIVCSNVHAGMLAAVAQAIVGVENVAFCLVGVRFTLLALELSRAGELQNSPHCIAALAGLQALQAASGSVGT